MKTIKYNKLIRDNIPDIIKQANKTCKTKVVSKEEALDYLFLKAHEEIDELKEAKSIEELADVIEVIEAIKDNLDFKDEDVLRIRQDKNFKNGAFKKRLVLLEVNEE